MARILIADDEWSTRQVLDEMLSAAGYEVAGVAENGREVIAMAEELQPDLILMDIVMPGGMDGISAAEKIKSVSNIPIIFISGYGDPEYVERAKRLEPFGYVMKPFHEDEVRAFVEIALYKSKIEKALEASNRELQRLRKEWEGIFQAIGNPTLILDDRRRVIHANAATLKETGMPAEKIIGRKCYEVFHHSVRPPKDCPYEKIIMTRSLETAEMEIEALDGTFLVSCTPLFDQEGRLEKAIHIATDITERKLAEMERERLETQLRQAQKMELVGTMTAGIAHDYNNLLSIILGNISLAKEEIRSNATVTKLLHRAEKASLKTRDLTHRLMALSEGIGPLREPGYIEELLGEILREVTPHKGVECALDIPDKLWSINYDPKQMHYSINNLLTNAIEAMPRGGVIRVLAENCVIEDHDQGLAPPLGKGKYVHIVIRDNGVGIPEKDLSRIFDPYFSTKDRGIQKGMGLGLTAAYAIIQKHDGYISVQSAPGEGTTVSIFLPAADEPVFEERQTEKGAGEVFNRKVLVMDDEEGLRDLAQMMLERLGCQVVTAKNGLEALEAYKKQMSSGKPFDVVILDLTVRGGMGGHQTIKALLEIDKGVRAIVSSGYSNDPIMANYKKYGFLAAIPKPYLMAELVSGLRQAVEERM